MQELPGIDVMLEALNTKDLGLMRDAANPLARKAIHVADMVANIFRKSGQLDVTETTETIKIYRETEPA